MHEIWKDVYHNNDYEVSNLGNVRNKGTKKILKPEVINSGYVRAKLPKVSNNGNQLIHRIVAMAFIPNPDNKPNINHIDANKLNNQANNLEWVTQKENMADVIKRGKLDTATARESLVLPKPVKQIDKDTGKVIKVWDSMKEASEALDKVQPSKISEVCNGTRPTSGGFKWAYANPEHSTTTKSIIRGKKILRISEDGTEVIFNTITKASESIDVDRGTLTRWLKKETVDGKITYNGYVWELI